MCVLVSLPPALRPRHLQRCLPLRPPPPMHLPPGRASLRLLFGARRRRTQYYYACWLCSSLPPALQTRTILQYRFSLRRSRKGCRLPLCVAPEPSGMSPTNQAGLWLHFGARLMQSVCLSGRHSQALLVDNGCHCRLPLCGAQEPSEISDQSGRLAAACRCEADAECLFVCLRELTLPFYGTVVRAVNCFGGL